MILTAICKSVARTLNCRADARLSSRGVCPSVCILLLLLMVAPIAGATIIVASCSAGKVIIGADGLTHTPDDPQPWTNTCKVHQGSADCFFAIAGGTDSRVNSYDLLPLARRACGEHGSLAERTERFKNWALPEIQRNWTFIKTDPRTKKSYNLIKSWGGNRVTAVFAGGPPFKVVVQEFVENSAGDMVAEEAKVDSCDGSTAHAAGYDLKGYLQEHPVNHGPGTAEFVKESLLGAIENEAATKPAESRSIGFPIAVAEIDSGGSRWLEQGTCPALANKSVSKAGPDPISVDRERANRE
jgi:hypothetical protein